MTMIDVDSLVYEYPGKRALSDVSFQIAAGSITALVGPNGAGKSTLLRCIAALDEPFSGNVRVAGVDVVRHPREVHRELGYLSDFFGVYPSLTVRQCLLFAARLRQLPERELGARVRVVAELLELTSYFDKKAGTLSRGWRQRLGIAQAIIHNPRLLLLDEPAAGLDPEARIALSALFRALRDQGMTLIVSSHILAELEDYCTDMLVLREGRLVQHSGARGAVKQESVTIELSVAEASASAVALLQSAPGVTALRVEEKSLRFMLAGNEEAQHALLKRLLDGGVKVCSFAVQHQRLQDVYMALGQGRTHDTH